MSSLYWDDFERRIEETVKCIKEKKEIPVRRVAVFITDKCNFRCQYCNVKFGKNEMAESVFDSIVNKYKDTSLIHITGGEPSVVSWLYPYIEKTNARFHLNTNGMIKPPENIKRLKVSLDTKDEKEFDELSQTKNNFIKVVNNIKEFSKKTITSITFVLNKKNYYKAPDFVRWCNKEFPDLYAVFFSAYKGDNKELSLSKEDADIFFNKIRFELEKEMKKETLELFKETVNQKFRIFGNERFPENVTSKLCYLSFSERVYNFKGEEFRCSHLFRDGLTNPNCEILEKCKNGCNTRLMQFNQEVEKKLGDGYAKN